MNWGYITTVFGIVLLLVQSPALAIFCVGIGLPPFYGTEKQEDGTRIFVEIDFDYLGSLIKLVTCLTSLIGVYYLSGMKNKKFLWN